MKQAIIVDVAITLLAGLGVALACSAALDGAAYAKFLFSLGVL